MAEHEILSAQDHGGGWVPLVFHDICDGCSGLAIRTEDFSALLDWLSQHAKEGISVSTVGSVIGGRPRPLVPGPPPSHPPGTLVNGTLIQPGLAPAPNAGTTDGEGLGEPYFCWSTDHYGTNDAAWQRTSEDGRHVARVAISAYTSGDAKLIIREDRGSCAPIVSGGQSFRLAAWYQTSAATRFVVFTANQDGEWAFWKSSPEFNPTTSWMHAVWTTPPLPSGTTRLSFGLSLAEQGYLTTSDYSLRKVRVGRSNLLSYVVAGAAAVVLLPLLGYIAVSRVRRRVPRTRTGP